MKKGFTLIELLVVIAIIGLLSSIILASLNVARLKARDAVRLSDIHQIQNALELYFTTNGHYPYQNGEYNWVYSNHVNWTNDTNWSQLQTDLSPYITTLPKDPINTAPNNPNGFPGPWNQGSQGNDYVYAYKSNDGVKYDLVAQFETDNQNSCQYKLWRFHTDGDEGIWCQGGFGLSSYLYADH